MQIFEILRRLEGLSAPHHTAPDSVRDVDGFKFGNSARDVKKVGVCFICTPEVLRAAAKAGVELLITHEPTFYGNMDDGPFFPWVEEKRRLLEAADITLYRYHDLSHFAGRDLIHEGFADAMGWLPYFDGKNRVVLPTPKTPKEIALQMEQACNLKHLRITGQKDFPIRNISLHLGAPAFDHATAFLNGQDELAVFGEICEWFSLEPARDAGQLGIAKTFFVLGHVGSERPGMNYVARLLQQACPEISVQVFDCGEVYSSAED